MCATTRGGSAGTMDKGVDLPTLPTQLTLLLLSRYADTVPLDWTRNAARLRQPTEGRSVAVATAHIGRKDALF